jgi:LytS/YehU family sensor histidine kinase
MVEILNNIIVNISILAFMGFFFSRIKRFRKAVFEHNKSWVEIALLSIIFGGIGIFSTYTGIKINGAIANTRVIGVIAGGFLAGPWVGLFAGIIAGLHRFAIDIHGFTAVSCAISTIIEGMIGGAMYRRVRFSKDKYNLIFLYTLLAEVVQMIVILIIAKPFSDAVELVRIISVPMVFLNPVGVTIFIYAINAVQEATERQNQHTMDLAFKIIDQALPHLRKGLDEANNLRSISKIICNLMQTDSVLLFNKEGKMGFTGSDDVKFKNKDVMAYVLKNEPKKISSFMLEPKVLEALHLPKNIQSVFVSPITLAKEVVAYTIMYNNSLFSDASTEILFIDRLTQLFSSQLSQIQLDHQTQLLQKAELKALQSQINPHFLFNALNAISGYTRENPERARQLLLSLASYFRNTLSTSSDFVDIQDEIEHVLSYLEIEKARFEEKLNVKISCDPSVHFQVPNFIIQPLIENAIKHGMKNTGLDIECTIEEADECWKISVFDNGKGMNEEQLKAFKSNQMDDAKIGLSNIHKRLKALYPQNSGVTVVSNEHSGTLILFFIPKEAIA